MTAPAASLAWARGTLARLQGKPVTDCPYKFLPSQPHEAALGQIWQAAWSAVSGGDEQFPVKRRREGAPRWARQLVGRETRKGIGRGRGKLGPRREWDAVELCVLDMAVEARWPHEQIARAIERTPQAIWAQIERQRKKVAA